MSTDVQMPSNLDVAPDKQSRRRSKDTEKAHRRASNFQNKKHKHDHKFRKRSQTFNSSNGKFFPPYKMRKKDFIIPPTKFLLGGNITDPLNLNSLQDEDINRAMNAVTPKSSPLPTPQHRKGEVEVIIPPNIADPLNLTAGDDDATYQAMLTSPIKKTQKKPKKNKKRKNRSSSGPGSGKEDSIEGARLDQSILIPNKDPKNENIGEVKTDIKSNAVKSNAETAITVKEVEAVPQKQNKADGHGNANRLSLRKMELKERKADLDKIVSPVIPQPGAWNDRHRFRPPPQRTPQITKAQALPNFKENDAKFQYGNYNRYYGYRNPNHCSDVRLKVLEKHKDLFRGKDILDIGCNAGHLTLAIARDFGPNKVVGLDIDRNLIQMARTNIRHYVNCGKKNKFFPVSMPIVYGPIDVPGLNEEKGFPHNISFVVGNYVLETDVQLSMEQPQFDVILCLSITKWMQLNWGDAGLKRAFRRMYNQLRPGGVLILEAQSWKSYKRKKQLTPEIWKNYHNIELFPHQFSQYLLSEIGFSKCEVIGSPMHETKGFQRPIKLFIKEDPSFDTPVYSANTSVCDSATPRYCRDTPGRIQHFANTDRYSFRLPDSVHFHDDFSGDSNFPYGTPSSINSPESGFSEGIQPRRYYPCLRPMDDGAGGSQNQGNHQLDSVSPSVDSRPSSVRYEVTVEEDNTISIDSCSQEIVDAETVDENKNTGEAKESMDIDNVDQKKQCSNEKKLESGLASETIFKVEYEQEQVVENEGCRVKEEIDEHSETTLSSSDSLDTKSRLLGEENTVENKCFEAKEPMNIDTVDQQRQCSDEERLESGLVSETVFKIEHKQVGEYEEYKVKEEVEEHSEKTLNSSDSLDTKSRLLGEESTVEKKCFEAKEPMNIDTVDQQRQCSDEERLESGLVSETVFKIEHKQVGEYEEYKVKEEVEEHSEKTLNSSDSLDTKSRLLGEESTVEKKCFEAKEPMNIDTVDQQRQCSDEERLESGLVSETVFKIEHKQVGEYEEYKVKEEVEEHSEKTLNSSDSLDMKSGLLSEEKTSEEQCFEPKVSIDVDNVYQQRQCSDEERESGLVSETVFKIEHKPIGEDEEYKVKEEVEEHSEKTLNSSDSLDTENG